MRTAGLTSKGRRESNQDSYFCGEFQGLSVLAVADGMGGHTGGEIASSLVIDAVTSLLKQGSFSEAPLREILSSVFERADQALIQKKSENPKLEGMGSTLACLLVRDGRFAAANLGDSRIYHLTDQGTVCITKDHTMLQEYIDQFGEPVPDEIQNNGHVLTKVIDGSGDKPWFYPGNSDSARLGSDDLFICISDGLLPGKMTPFEQILEKAAAVNRDPELLAAALLENALKQGSRDNCTVVIGSTEPAANSREPAKTVNGAPGGKGQKKEREQGLLPRTRWLLTGTAVLLALFLIALGWLNREDLRIFSHESLGFLSRSETTPLADIDSLTTEAVWERGFTDLSLDTPFYSGSRIAWYPPDGEEASFYYLKFYQNENLVYEDSTSATSFVLNDQHGYRSGSLDISIYTVLADSLYQPDARSGITLTYQYLSSP